MTAYRAYGYAEQRRYFPVSVMLHPQFHYRPAGRRHLVDDLQREPEALARPRQLGELLRDARVS